MGSNSGKNSMNEHIKVAQALAEFPPEAGLDKWPCGLYEIKVDGEFNYRIWDNELAAELMEQTDLIYDSMRKISGWLLVDDLSLWSAAEFLERCGARLGSGHIYLPFSRGKQYLSCWDDGFHLPTNLDYMKAILTLGQRAFGLGRYANWTDDQRKPYRAAWERGMDAS